MGHLYGGTTCWFQSQTKEERFLFEVTEEHLHVRTKQGGRKSLESSRKQKTNKIRLQGQLSRLLRLLPWKDDSYAIYVDDGIFAGPDKGEIAALIRRMQGEFNITDEGDIKK
jgi:hypothetical protein